jgi:hypothetical protein
MFGSFRLPITAGAAFCALINPDKTLYDPELMHEVWQAVEREHLAVDTVYAMHEGPARWSDVVSLLEKAA